MPVRKEVAAKKIAQCNLFVVGSKGVGKTTLIKWLTEYDQYDRNRTRGLPMADWILSDGKDEVILEIKELESLKTVKNLKSYDNVIVLVVFNIGDSKRNNNHLEEIRILSPNATIFAVFSVAQKVEIQKLSLASLKAQYPYIKYWVPMPNIFKISSDETYEFKSVFRNIILNRFTNRLDNVRALIKRNLSSKGKTLDLGKCGLTSLDEVKEVFSNAHLETLIVSNEWGEYVNGGWERKTSSNPWGDNVLFEIPGEIQKLRKLKVLVCGGNWKSEKQKRASIKGWHITDISVLSNLVNLTSLNLSNNEIEQVDSVVNFRNLKILHINNNRISVFPNISNLTFLEEINLSNNYIVKVNFAKDSRSLKTLDLHSNRITDLTSIRGLITKLDIRDSKWEVNTISIANNPLSIPRPQVIAQGRDKVIAYFDQLEAEQKINLPAFINRDIKLILVGNSNAGKSTLIHWLEKKRVNKNIATTHWMEVKKWKVTYKKRKYAVRIFDFGGQEYYHDTHYLFFTNNTAYLVLWETLTNHFDEIELEQRQLNGEIKPVKIQSFPLEYWLDSINFHTKKRNRSEAERAIAKLLDDRDASVDESIKKGEDWTKHIYSSQEAIGGQFLENENVLVVQNKVDKKIDKNFIDQEELKTKYPKIFDFSDISVLKKRGLNSLNELIFEIFDSMPILGQEYLGTWGAIKQKIESGKFSEPFQLKEFKKYCNNIISNLQQVKGKNNSQKKKVLFSDQDTESFAQYLSDIGMLLYYPENPLLKDKVFINQEQVLDNIYAILLDLNATNGEFNQELVLRVLRKKMMDSEAQNTINLMLHFKIIFDHPTKDKTYIAPLYLPKEPVQGVKIFSSLFSMPTYRFQYKSFIYKNVILDFFSRYGKKVLIEPNNSNLYYYWKEGIVVKDELSKEIVMVKFIPASKSGQKAFINVHAINGSASESFLNKVIVDIDDINKDLDSTKCVSVNGADFVPLKFIHDNEEKENWVFLYDNKYYKLTDFKKYLKKPIKMKNIFISYSKQDHRLVAKFQEHLTAMKRDGKVATWYCSELEAGSVWTEEIQKRMDEADIICFMVSPNFMKTEYIHEHEIAKAFEKKAKNPNFRIVPIILDFCRWSTTNNDLSQFTALPYTVKPVMDFDNQNMAWYIIEECLRLMIDNDLEPVGESFYAKQKLPLDILKIYNRIVEDRVDKNTK